MTPVQRNSPRLSSRLPPPVGPRGRRLKSQPLRSLNLNSHLHELPPARERAKHPPPCRAQKSKRLVFSHFPLSLLLNFDNKARAVLLTFFFLPLRHSHVPHPAIQDKAPSTSASASSSRKSSRNKRGSHSAQGEPIILEAIPKLASLIVVSQNPHQRQRQAGVRRKP